MKKYELRKETREISWKERNEIKEGCTLDQADLNPVIVKEFEEKESALEELKKYDSDIRTLSGAAGTYFLVTEYYVEENTYDEEGEWELGGDIVEFSKIDTSVIE